MAVCRLRWEPLGGRPYFEGETEPCINGAILAAPGQGRQFTQ